MTMPVVLAIGLALGLLIILAAFTYTCEHGEESENIAVKLSARSSLNSQSDYDFDSTQLQVHNFIKYYEPLKYQLSFSPSHKKRNVEKQHEGSLYLSFTAFGKFFDIHLYRQSEIFARDATVQVINAEGVQSNKKIETSHLYEGYVLGDSSSNVHGHIMNGIFDGIIKTSNDSFHLEPATWYYSNISSPYHSIIYKESDVFFPSHLGTANSVDNVHNILRVQYQKYLTLDNLPKDTNIFSSLYFTQSNLTDLVKQTSISETERSSSTARPHLKEWDDFTSGAIKKPLKQNASVEGVDNTSNSGNTCDGCSDVKTVRTCNLYIVIDHTFFLTVASDVMQALAEVAYHIEEADTVYRATDFNGDGIGDNVGLSIGGVTIFESAESENYILSDNYDQAVDYLSQFALYNFDAYCLGIVFTSRDFDNGVLGLAWVGYASPHGPPGGICQQRVIYRDDGQPSSLNTALVTTTNYGNKVLRQVTSITVMHEIAHAFGSLHDPATSACAPDGSYGNYIMFAKATNGDKPFNAQFSSCSTSEMAPVISVKGPLCFQFHSGPYCGNQVVEDGEECDCGTAVQCIVRDKCCTPQGGMGKDEECTFTRQFGSICSPYSSSCCTEDCKLIAPSRKHVCLEETECTEQSICNGKSMDCPEPQHKPNSTHCGSGKTCLSGMCQLSICSTLGLMMCSCVEDNDNMCQVCCQIETTCLPVSSIAPNKTSIRQSVGSACNNYTGYCDFYGKCIMVDSDSALHRLKQLFTKKGVDDFGEWIQTNWYYAVAVVLGVVLVSKMAKIIHHRNPSESRQMTERAARLSAVWKKARQQKRILIQERQRIMNMHSHSSLTDG